MKPADPSRWALPTTLLALLAVSPLAATSYVMVSDEALADQAPYAVVARVTAIDSVVTAEGSSGPRLFTEYQLEVEWVLKRDPGRTLTLRLPGGEWPDGVGLKLSGMPRLHAGERALLFLEPDGHGAYRPLHLILGAFREISVGGRDLAVRNLAEAREMRVTPAGVEPQPPERGDLLRDFDAFARWVADRAAGVTRPRDYLLDDASGELRHQVGKYTLFEDLDDGLALRWFDFDTGGSVQWKASRTGQQGIADGGYSEFRVALHAWNHERRTPIDYRYGGKTSSQNGLEVYDGVNSIVFDDPTDLLPSFSCSAGGVLALGGPWYTTSSVSFQGKRFHRIVNGDIVINTGLRCFFESSPDGVKAAQELFAHELGHTLGLGHSCGESDGPDPRCSNPALDDALMRAFIHDDRRGARLNGDDRAGVRRLYHATGNPAAPPD